MTLTVLAIVGVVQLIFALLLTGFIFVHRYRRERRALAESQGLARLAGPVREWLVGDGGVEQIRAGLDALPAATARYTALRIGRNNLAIEQRQEFAAFIRDRSWVQDGLASVESPWWWKRLDAARLLADLGTPADELFVRRLLRDSHPAVRAAATSCLRRIANPGVIEVVLDELPRQPLVVRTYQLSLLREQWQLAREALLPRLTLHAPAQKLPHWVNVAEALETPDVLARCVPLHVHESPPVRITVARAMKKYFHPDAGPVLLKLLADPDWRVRAQAARSMGALRDLGTIPALATRLTDASWWVRFRSALALSQLGEQGRAALREARKSPDKYAAQMATMVAGLSPGSVVELVEG